MHILKSQYLTSVLLPNWLYIFLIYIILETNFVYILDYGSGDVFMITVFLKSDAFGGRDSIKILRELHVFILNWDTIMYHVLHIYGTDIVKKNPQVFLCIFR